MTTNDWNDIRAILNGRELKLRQCLEEIRALGGEPSQGLLDEYRLTCKLISKLELYLAEALPV